MSTTDKAQDDNILTIEDVNNLVEQLNKQRGETIELIQNHFLLPQTVLKSGNKIYYSPEIKSGEVTIITIPEIDTQIKPFEVKFFNTKTEL